MSLKLYDSVV